jgi:hypothetical protein
MHRGDAATVSFTEIHVTSELATLNHTSARPPKAERAKIL